MVRRLGGAIGDSDDATPTQFTVVKLYQKSSKNPPDMITYRKVASSRLSRIVAHLRIYRLFMKGKFDAYVL